jgi:DNA-binding transcriptional ArsR family regulator
MTKRSPFQAIADPTRRRILDMLKEEGPLRAGDLAKQFPEISRPAVSRHIRILRGASLVKPLPQGRERWYRLNPEPLDQVQQWLEDYERFWQEKLESLKQMAEELPDSK